MSGVYEIRKINALIRFYLKIDPDELDDEQWARTWGDLVFALEFEANRTVRDINI